MERTMEWLEYEHFEVEINVAENVMIDIDDGESLYIPFATLEKIYRTAQRLRLGSVANK